MSKLTSKVRELLKKLRSTDHEARVIALRVRDNRIEVMR